MKDAIAIWWDTPKANSADVSIELDVNVWLSKKYRDDYLEFGLRISNYTKIKKVYIYLPFLISESDTRDMIPELKESDTANALFNEQMSVVTNDSGLYEVNYVTTDKKEFLASCTEIKSSQIESSNGGCILTLDIPDNDSFSNILYKRIRINKIEQVINEFSENNFIIDGFFKKLRTVEISINTTRKLPFNIVDRIKNKINLKSINFFLMTDIFTDIVFKSQDIKSSRILEDDIWNKYLGIDEKKNKEIKKVIAYQWKTESKKAFNNGICSKDIKKIFSDLSQSEYFKETPESIQKLFNSLSDTKPSGSNPIEYESLQDYNLFVKFSMVKKQGLVFALSILSIIIFGIISGYGGNRFTDFMDSIDNNETNCSKNIESHTEGKNDSVTSK